MSSVANEPAAPASSGAERRVPGLTPTLRWQARLLFRLVSAVSPTLAAHLAAYLFVRPRARRISEPEARFLKAARAQRLATPVGTIQLYEWPAPGTTVLVVHGWRSHAARLQELIQALHGRGLRVIACDAPAHGRSSGSQADLLRYRATLAAASRACGPIAGVIAHSFGAMAAVSWLAEDAAASSVQAAVLVGLPRDVGYLLESFILAVQLSPSVVERLRGLFHARYGRYPEEFSASALARSIHIPVLLVHGTDDDLVPIEHADQVVAQLSGGRLHIAAGLNHSAPLRDAATVAMMVEFLAEHLGRYPDVRTAEAR